MTTSSPDLTTTQKYECWFEYTPSYEETAKHGLRRIDDPDDPRWDKELMEPPFKGGCEGSLIVAKITRINGEEVKRETPKRVRFCHKNKAHEFMKQFKELSDAGAERPWDQEHYHRNLEAEAIKARDAQLQLEKEARAAEREDDRAWQRQLLETLVAREVAPAVKAVEQQKQVQAPVPASRRRDGGR